jgi:hypothetical protein
VKRVIAMRKVLSLIALVLGLFSLAAVLIVRFAVAPAKAVLPSDTDTTRTYTGTAATLLNPAVLTGGSGPALLTNVPVTVTHRDAVLQTKGGNALVSDIKIVTANGAKVAGVDYKYAVDRTNLGEGTKFAGVVAQKGITFNWPVRTEKHNYIGWVSDTHATTVLKYTGTAKRGGLTTYVFTTMTAPARITDSQVLAALPQALPRRRWPSWPARCPCRRPCSGNCRRRCPACLTRCRSRTPTRSRRRTTWRRRAASSST